MNRTTLRVRINQAGSQANAWYHGQLHAEFVVTLSSCAQLMGEQMASGWVQLNETKTGNSIELTHVDILHQEPHFIKHS